jgi:hypothetical protein
MSCCIKGTAKSPANGTYLGYPQLAPPSEIKKTGDKCFRSRFVCTDIDRCTEAWNYICPGTCKTGDHWSRIINEEVPCPPELEPPTPTQPRTVEDCEGRDKVSYVVIDGRRTARTVIQANAPECIPDNPPRDGSSCAANPGMAPPSDGGSPWSLNTSGKSDNPSMQYAFGTGQAGVLLKP